MNYIDQLIEQWNQPPEVKEQPSLFVGMYFLMDLFKIHELHPRTYKQRIEISKKIDGYVTFWRGHKVFLI